MATGFTTGRIRSTLSLYPDIRSMVLKTSGMVEVLRHVLDQAGVKIAFVFGSFAPNQKGPRVTWI